MGQKIVARNKKASYDYELLETFKTGIVLQGTEVKTLRSGRATMNEAHISIDRKGEVWLYNMSIPHYEFGNITNHSETRKRKLLLNRKEIDKIELRKSAGGLTIIPLKIYFEGSLVKVDIALARGKKKFDKRQDEMKKDSLKKVKNYIDR